MESDCRDGATSGEKSSSAVGRGKSITLPPSTRLQRNQAEKQRRDRLNGYITELASLVPMVSNATKPLDKVSILRLAAAQMRLNFSCLNPKKFKCKVITLPPSIMTYLDVIEKTVGGFVLATTFSGCIVFCSKSVEDYVGYQNIDLMGNSIFSYIHNGDVSYFEKKVNSVISYQQKGSKKKTKVIKAHMQQRPLPRSNDVRYRKMIFKLSVHVNETSDDVNSRSSTTPVGKLKKKGRTKDFGTTAVVLMFVEPVRLEPEIDISYIEAHQDAYFTMHGSQGEIIYADQRISSITGYMPHDVQGTSAYQYICSSDVPIALFAQKAMFSSNDGTGIIVYRLRIRDMRYIYLQSSGQIAYKNSTREISHFACFNKLLSDEEGSRELKKFKERFEPQILAATASQRNQGSQGEKQVCDSPLSKENADHASPVITEREMFSPQMNSSDVLTSACEGNSDGLSVSRSSEHSTNPIVSPLSIHSEMNSSRSPSSDLLLHSASSDAFAEAASPLKLNGHNGLAEALINRIDSSVYAVNPLTTVIDDTYKYTNVCFTETKELQINGLPDVSSVSTNRQTLNQNAAQTSDLNRSLIESIHSVNVNNSSLNSLNVNGTRCLPRDCINLDYTVMLPKDNTYASTSDPFLNHVANDSSESKDQASFSMDVDGTLQPAHFTSYDSIYLQNAESNRIAKLKYGDIDQNQLNSLNFSNLESLNGVYNTALDPSLSEHLKRLSEDSGYCDAAEPCLENGVYHKSSRYTNGYVPENVDFSNNTIPVGNGHALYPNGFSNPDPTRKSFCEEPVNSNAKSTDLFHLSVSGNLNKNPSELSQISAFRNVYRAVSAEDAGTLPLKDPAEIFCYPNERIVDINEWDKSNIHPDVLETMKADMNRELYKELDMFFENFQNQPPDLQSFQEALPDLQDRNSISSVNTLS